MAYKTDQSAQQTVSIDDLVEKIKDNINTLADQECEPKPPGCDGNLGSGTYDALARQVQEANSSRRSLISDIKKDFNTLAGEIGH